MPVLLDRLAWRSYSAAKAVITASGIKHTAVGRRLVGALNVVGRMGARLLLGTSEPARVDGHLMYLASGDAPSFSFSTNMLSGLYERETADLFKAHLRTGMTVLDVGAHVGFYSLLAARLVGKTGRVYAFEPDPDNRLLLERNVALNGYPNIVVVPKAVTDAVGTVSLFRSPQGNDRHSIYRNPRSIRPEESADVETTSIDAFLAGEGWPGVDFIKMDIEGAEPKALAGMAELLKRGRPFRFVVEFAPESLESGGCDPLEFLHRLQRLGFAVRSVESEGPPQALHEAELAAFVERLEGQGVRNLLCDFRT